MDLLPDTDERAERLFREYASPQVAKGLYETYKSYRKDYEYPIPQAYIMALYDRIEELDYELTWGDDD